MDLNSILNDFHLGLQEFNTRSLETGIMILADLERIRKFIIDSIKSSYLDSIFVQVEQSAHRILFLSRLYCLGTHGDFSIIMERTLNRTPTPDRILEIIQTF
jgi:hypothetical protein